MGGDLLVRYEDFQSLAVSIHASAWEATLLHARARCNRAVSIHASAWEATCRGAAIRWARGVSIHASAWEATHCRRPHGRVSRRFNPRLRVGGDLRLSPSLRPRASFNPRLRVGGDVADLREVAGEGGFNPRLRVGGDHRACHPRPDNVGFNPRLRVGGDRGRPQPARIKVLRGPFRESAVWRCPAFRIFYSYTIIVLYSNMLDVSRIFLQKAVNLRSPLQKINGPSGS